MITADMLKTLISMTPRALTGVLQASGYKKDKVNEAKFLGMTNAGQFCYEVDYDNFGTMEKCKLFVKYDQATSMMTADY